MKKVIKVKGLKLEHYLKLSGMIKSGIDYKKIPPYFTIEIDTTTIKAREKNK